jgi:hypothetical protein
VSLLAAMSIAALLAGCGGGGMPGNSGGGSSSGGSSGGSSSGGSAGGGSSSGGSAAAGFWVPFLSAATGAGGSTGLVVVPSTNPSAAPVNVAAGTVIPIGGADQITLNANAVPNLVTPSLFAYAATGADGRVHLYGLNLGNTAVSPAPVQISNLAVASLAALCNYGQGQTNILDPATLYFVVHVAPPGGACGTGVSTGDTWEFIGYGASPTTAPTPLAGITTTQFTSLYTPSGSLGGVVSLDPASDNVYFYAAAGDAPSTFAHASVLVSGATAYTDLYVDDGLKNDNGAFTGTTDFINVTTTSGASPVQRLYRVTYAGSAAPLVPLYQAAGTLSSGVADADSLYFTDTYQINTFSTAGVPSIAFLQEPLTGGGAPRSLYATPTGANSYSLVAANGSVLVFAATALSGGTTTSTLASLATTTGQSAVPDIIAGFAGVIGVTALAPALGDSPSSQSLYVNISSTTAGATAYATEVLTPAGPVSRALQANSRFLGQGTPFDPGILEVRGITDGNGGLSGGTLYHVNLATLAATPIKTAAGANYVVPANSEPLFLAQSTTFAAGSLVTVSSGNESAAAGLLADVSQNILYTISLPNSSVTPAF